jgi:hypothetical protein
MLPAAALGTFCYTSTTTGFQYCLNTVGDDFAGAARTCSLAASQLVSYGSLKEQQEVENYFIDSGARARLCGIYIPHGRMRSGRVMLGTPRFT